MFLFISYSCNFQTKLIKTAVLRVSLSTSFVTKEDYAVLFGFKSSWLIFIIFHLACQGEGGKYDIINY